MRTHRLTTLLLTVCCGLAGRLGWAQRAAVAPLAPLPPVVRPAPSAAWLRGVPVGAAPARQSPAPAATAPVTQHNWPVFLLNSRIILGGLGLSAINPQDIADIHVYRTADAPAQWRSIAANGMLAITLKPKTKSKLKTKSLAAIRRQAKVSGRVSFKLNGLPLEDATLRIAKVSVAGLDVQRDASETVINIRLASPKPSPPRHDPSGTIYIRGMASR